MNKRGDWKVWAAGVILILLVIFISVEIINQSNIPIGVKLKDASGILGAFYDGAVAVLKVVKEVAVPVGLDENQQMVALGVFGLLVIIGTRALYKNVFKSGPLAFVVALLVGLIASRSLSNIIIKEYISGSAVASAAFLVGLLPLLMVYGFMKEWTGGAFGTKLIMWCLLASIYLFVFGWAFNSWMMGWFYCGAIVLAAAVDIFGPYLASKAKEQKNLTIGRFIGMTHKDLQSWRDMQKGATQEGVNLSEWNRER